MKGKITRTTSRSRIKGRTDFEQLRRMRDAEIDDSDIPRLDESFWKTATLSMPEPKDRLTIRVDHDVVEWLKKDGSGYQTRINAILRSYMKAKSGGDTGSRTKGL
ncbi:MAG: BrnA antitoxin family protein [Terriglobales bacterium]